MPTLQECRQAVLDALADGHPNPEGYLEWFDSQTEQVQIKIGSAILFGAPIEQVKQDTKATPSLGWHAQFEWKLADFWIGAFWKRTGNCIDLWICLLPCVPLHVSWWWSDHHPNAAPLPAPPNAPRPF